MLLTNISAMVQLWAGDLMSEKTKKTNTNAKRRYLTKRNIIALGGGLVILIVGLVVFLTISVKEGDQSDSSGGTEEPFIMAPVGSSSDVANKIESTEDNKEKAKLYLDMAISKQREDDMQGALDAALASAELEPSHLAYASAGAMYRGLGDTENAVEMYKKALSLTERTENPNKVSFYNDYRMVILDLGGQVDE